MQMLICEWEWNLRDNVWKQHESYIINSDGHRVGNTKVAIRNPYTLWVTDEAGQPIWGRAVTSCSLVSGIRLLHFNPPYCVSFLVSGCFDKICEQRDFYNYVGHDLFFGTKDVAENQNYWREWN